MYPRIVRRALAAGLSIAMIAVGLASADVLEPVGDAIVTGGTELRLGTVAAGQTVVRNVPLRLVCSNTSHVAHGTTVRVTQGLTLVEKDGSMSVTDGSVGPVPTSWPQSGSHCPSPAPVLTGSTLVVTVVAPTVPGPYTFVAVLSRTPTTGTGSSSITAILTVGGNTAPTVTVPADFTVEGDTTGGWAAAYTVSASDAEDDADPVVSCSPGPGTVLAPGANTVTCSATDADGLTSTASFTVTVTDTTPPALGQLPADVTVDATSADGTVVTYDPPTATDVVDPAPAVHCSPTTGATFGVGTTTVTCSATDDTGNTASGTFVVTVQPLRTLTAGWGEPVGDAAVVSANRGRTLPLKAVVAVDGTPVVPSGDVRLQLERLDACGGTVVDARDGGAMTWDGGRWTTNLDTSPLAVGCWRVSVRAGAVAGGAFELRLVDGAVGTGGTIAARGPRTGR